MYSEDLDCWIEKGTRSDRTPVVLCCYCCCYTLCCLNNITTCNMDQNDVNELTKT